MNTLKGAKAVYYTLGCKLNFAETSTIQQQLEALGVAKAKDQEEANICIVNTCSVTEVADSKSRQAISRLHRKYPKALMVVTGCYRPPLTPPLWGENFLFIDGKQKGKIVQRIAETLGARNKEQENTSSHCNSPAPCHTPHTPFAPACARGERTRFFLKVQDGCNYFCTYCTIPFSRGRSRNGSIASLVQQAKDAAKEGGKEIVLTGVNIGDFGKTTGEKFIDLLQALDEVEDIQRYRISSIEPNLLTEEIIKFCSESRAFMPHFHIPLQSGSDEVLKLMHRRYDTKFFAQKIEEVRKYIPDAFIGVDVIVGMRGETDELFAKAHEFMQALPVSQYHVFSYSERPGTKALQIPGIVTPQQKHERSQQILSISDDKLRAYYNKYIGQTRPVLLEKSSSNASIGGRRMQGFTDNYIRTEISAPQKGKQVEANTIVRIRLNKWNETGDALIGEIEK